MEKPLVIEKSQPTATDWRALVDEGITLLEQFAGGIWTDYNEHDPGVTLLEALAYGLTDLGYRADLDIPDLMTDEHGTLDRRGACFYTPPEIFPCAPVTLLDLRKLLLDRMPDLANVWITPRDEVSLPGYFDVWLVPRQQVILDSLGTAAENTLSEFRQLGDVFQRVTIAPTVSLSFTLKLEISPTADKDQVRKQVTTAVARVLTPPIEVQPYPAPSECTHPDQLFEGPLLSRGFFRDEDMWEPRKPSELEALVRQGALSVKQVEAVVSLKWIPSRPENFSQPRVFSWAPEADDIVFHCGRSFKPSSAASPNVSSAPETRGLGIHVRQLWAESVQPGHFMDVAQYSPVQDVLPPIYKLGPNALPPQASPQTSAKISQLRAYLFVFEQILANACAQLAHAPRLLSCNPPEPALEGHPRPALVWQPLYALHGAQTVLRGTQEATPDASQASIATAWTEYQKDASNPYVSGMRALLDEQNEAFGESERFLDHLLARFGESFPFVSWQNFETAEQKRRFLARYPELSENRQRAFDVERARSQMEPGPSMDNVSWLERKVNLLLAAGPREPLKTYQHNDLPFAGAGNPNPPYQPYLKRCYYLVEYPLFLGGEAGSKNLKDCENDPNCQPYSKSHFASRLVHVLTNWTYWEPVQSGFREYVQSFILDSAPVHLTQAFLWLEPDADGHNPMDDFLHLLTAWYKDGLPPLQISWLTDSATQVGVTTSGAAFQLMTWIDAKLGGSWTSKT